MKTPTGSLVSTALTALVFFVQPAPAQGASCTVIGHFEVEPQDLYYCDTNSLSCGGWNVVDLDRHRNYDLGAMPLRHVMIRIYEGWSNTNWRASGVTNGNGDVTIPFTISAGSCSGAHVRVAIRWTKHAGGDPLTRRFRITDRSGMLYETAFDTSLFASTTTFSQNFDAFNTPPSTISGRIANIFYTTESAIREITSWTSNLSSEFQETDASELRIEYDNSNPGTVSDVDDWYMKLDYNEYRKGGVIRHELGHFVQYALYNRAQSVGCISYAYGGDTSHSLSSCEYGFPSTDEGLATFWGARSATSNDNDTWYCYCGDDTGVAPQNQCSTRVAASLAGDTNKLIDCGPGGANQSIFGIGDTWVNSTAQCINPIGDGPDCSTSAGWRNETQVVRFLWDLIDDGEESGDDTNETASSLAETFEGWSCSGIDDGSCNEHVDLPGCSYDKVNAYDISDIVALNQSDERALNCVQNAPD